MNFVYMFIGIEEEKEIKRTFPRELGRDSKIKIYVYEIEGLKKWNYASYARIA